MGFIDYSVPRPESDRIYLTVLWTSCLAAYLVGSIWYWTRRSINTIAARHPGLLIANLVVLWVNLGLGGLLALWFPTAECDGFWWLSVPSTWALLGLFAIGVWRCLVLIQKFESQRIKLALQLVCTGVCRAVSPAVWCEE